MGDIPEIGEHPAGTARCAREAVNCGPRDDEQAHPELVACLHRARQLSAAGNWRDAADALKYAARLAPEQPMVWCTLATAYYGAGEIELALVASQKLIELATTWPVGWFQRALGYSRQGRYCEAIRDYTEAIRLAPAASRSFTANINKCSDAIGIDSAARISRAECRMRLGDHQGALNDLDAVASDNPLWADGFAIRARIHRMRQDFESAWADCDTALTLDADCGSALATRGCIHAHFRRDMKAIADFSRSIELRSDEVFAYAARGHAYARLRQFDRAIADYSQAIRLSPRWAEAYEARGRAYFRRGEWHSAIDDFSRALEIKPNLTSALQYRGFAREAIGDYDCATRDRLIGEGLLADDESTRSGSERQRPGEPE